MSPSIKVKRNTCQTSWEVKAQAPVLSSQLLQPSDWSWIGNGGIKYVFTQVDRTIHGRP